jgi:5-methylthioadenosine/S-adenosylhomocysteine deaminase
MPDSIKIIENGYVFTGDAQQRSGMLTILIRNDRIAEISTRGDALKAMHANAEVIDASGRALFPGFVDPHYHGDSFLLRPLTNRLPLLKWGKDPELSKAFEFLREVASLEQLTTMYRLGFRAALQSGVTALADAGIDTIDRTLKAALDAFSQSDLRGLMTLHNGDQVDFAKTRKNTAVRFLLAAAGEDDLTTYNLQTTARVAREARWPMVMQAGETRKQFDALKKNFQKSPIQLLNEYKLFDQPVMLVHLAHFESGDIQILSQARMPILFSPNAIAAKATDIPPFAELIAADIPIALCGDWGVSDPLANVRTLMALASFEGVQNLQPFSLLDSITRFPAMALGLFNEIGSLEPGKKADIAAVDISRFRFSGFTPSVNAGELLHLIFAECSSSDMSEVMVNGEFYVREHTLLTYSEEDLANEGKTLFRDIVAATGRQKETRPSSPSVANVFSVDVREDAPQLLDEGFRIVKKVDEPVRAAILPMMPTRNTELSGEVRKVFGDDEEF